MSASDIIITVVIGGVFFLDEMAVAFFSQAVHLSCYIVYFSIDYTISKKVTLVVFLPPLFLFKHRGIAFSPYVSHYYIFSCICIQLCATAYAGENLGDESIGSKTRRSSPCRA